MVKDVTNPLKVVDLGDCIVKGSNKKKAKFYLGYHVSTLLFEDSLESLFGDP